MHCHHDSRQGEEHLVNCDVDSSTGKDALVVLVLVLWREGRWLVIDANPRTEFLTP